MATTADGLERYWKAGPGAKKWIGTAHPWTNLMRHLTEHVGRERAERIASQWFKDVFGIWPGERAGKNPAGPG